MIRSPFDPSFEALPQVISIFPLPGALLLPGGRLPLNIFEPRYLNMVRDALTGPRFIGMIQPAREDADVGQAEVYPVGCAGRIVAFSETDDGRYLITLAGLIRFRVSQELEMEEGYRRVVPDYARYRDDLYEEDAAMDRAGLMESLRPYLEAKGIDGDWSAIEKSGDESLLTSLAMACPFAPEEKQALLEAITLGERAEALIAILKMAMLDTGADAPRQ